LTVYDLREKAYTAIDPVDRTASIAKSVEVALICMSTCDIGEQQHVNTHPVLDNCAGRRAQPVGHPRGQPGTIGHSRAVVTGGDIVNDEVIRAYTMTGMS
jgi:hypothetical protein